MSLLVRLGFCRSKKAAVIPRKSAKKTKRKSEVGRKGKKGKRQKAKGKRQKGKSQEPTRREEPTTNKQEEPNTEKRTAADDRRDRRHSDRNDASVGLRDRTTIDGNEKLFAGRGIHRRLSLVHRSMVTALSLLWMAFLSCATMRPAVRAWSFSRSHGIVRTAVSMSSAMRTTTTTTSTTDTIFALSSGPLTKTGVAVVRISGPAARMCLEELTLTGRPTARKPQAFPDARRASLRYLYCPRTRDVLDHALVLWFPGPRSFTGEDIVELHCHGGRAVILGVFGALEHLDDTLAATLRQQGAGDDGSSGGARRSGIRPADRGEFTRRAFENGRMDLTEVEGLSDLLAADTSEQRKQALRQMDGYLRQFFERWREELLGCLAHTEAVIDFGDDDREDDVNDGAMYALLPRVRVLREELLVHLRDGRRGELVRDGVKIALAGPPNAGKSSLMNALARRPAAIVSPIAGTTRDIVEVRMDLGGIPCIISDTAGLRAGSSDPIEVEGMLRARTGVCVCVRACP